MSASVRPVGTGRCCCLGVVVFAALAAAAQLVSAQQAKVEAGAMTVIRPTETDEILANPGVGWETFHRTAARDRALPPWIPSSVHYARWGWRTLEPNKGDIDDAFVDRVLKETRQAGQKLTFRAMCCSSYPRRPYHPDWLHAIGGKVVVTRYGDGPELEVPVLGFVSKPLSPLGRGWVRGLNRERTNPPLTPP